MPRNWQTQISEELSNVQKLVHLAFRQTADNEEQIRGELVKIRRRAYEEELSIQAGRIGCAGRQGRLTTGDALKALNKASKEDAKSIVNTYNADLVAALQVIKSETPTANRNVYAKRLEEWDTNRSQWKIPQIAMFTENSARSMAQADFYRLNGVEGMAELEPKTAEEPICGGWINRGLVPIKEALQNPVPFHPNCPHLWVIRPDKVARQDCADLWPGE